MSLAYYVDKKFENLSNAIGLSYFKIPYFPLRLQAVPHFLHLFQCQRLGGYYFIWDNQVMRIVACLDF